MKNLTKCKVTLVHEWHSRYIGYRNNPKCWDKYTFANGVDPDQTPQDQGLHCLPYIQQYFNTSRGSIMEYFKFKDKKG